MKNIAFALMLLVWIATPAAFSAPKEKSLKINPAGYFSPDKSIRLNLDFKNGELFYRISKNGKTVLENSPLGIETVQGSFSRKLHPAGSVSKKGGRYSYSLNISKKHTVNNAFTNVIVPMANEQGKRMDVVFSLTSEGFAYQYRLYGQGGVTVLGENSGFKLPVSTKAFLTPLSVAHSGWARTNPSYEEHYQYDIPVGTPSTLGCGWTYPALFNVPGASWVLISESGVSGSYCATHLSHLSPEGLYRTEFPNPEEGLPTQHAKAMSTLPLNTPWRTVILGETPSEVANSTLITDLVKPLYKAKYNYKPGKATWSWVVLKDDSVTFDVTRRFIDMADTLNFEYCLVDAPWDKQIGRDRIAELADYGHKRGVDLILWYNSNGKWNDAYQTPKNCMDNQDARRKEMKWMQSIGIKGIKVDFFGGDKQFYMQYYEDILRDANDYGITVNFHGTTLPRGWERMFPNFVTDESVKGMEFITFEQENADRQPQHCATLPFIRNVAGPMDFTPVILNARLGTDRKSGPFRRTTMGFELALPVVLFSGVQHLGLVPENTDQIPAEAVKYLKEVPTVWDETHFIAGYPGKECLVARRSGTTWYVAGINGEKTDKEFSPEVKKLFKGSYEAVLIQDVPGEGNQVTAEATNKTPAEILTGIKVNACGGFVLILKEKQKK